MRRPHAYTFIEQHAGAVVPGVVLLEADGRFVAAVSLQAKDAGKALLDALDPPTAGK